MWTGPVILTLCISVVALLMSGAALIWQVTSWRRSGPRIEVATRWGIAGTPPAALWFISIQAKNSGRLGTEINQVGFQLPKSQDHKQLVATEDALGLPIRLPIALGPGASTSVLFSVPGFLGALRNMGASGEGARPFVDTGHGRKLGKPKHLGEMLERLNRPAEPK